MRNCLIWLEYKFKKEGTWFKKVFNIKLTRKRLDKMKCMSQYIRIISLKMWWVRIWATFGIQTFADRKVNLLPHGQPLFTYYKWRDDNNTMPISCCRQKCKSSTLCSKTKSWSLETLRQIMIMIMRVYTCNVPNKDNPGNMDKKGTMGR